MTDYNVERMTMIEGTYSPKVEKLIKLEADKKEQFTNEMKVFSHNFLKTHFDMEMNIPITIDGRLTSSGGTFRYKRKSKTPVEIKMSERFVACALLDESSIGIQAILDVLKHELVHYALCHQGKNFRDGHADFENKLAELGIGSSGATAEHKRVTKKRNVWYTLYDIYISPSGRRYKYNHTKQPKRVLGKRVGYEIEKSEW